jgi:hypothetical protein
MSFNLTAGNPRAHRIRVYYEGSDSITEGMPLCYNYLSTDNWFGGSVSAGVVTENLTTAEGSQNEGKYIRVGSPVVVDEEDNTPASSSKVITGDEDALNNIKVGHWVTITGTDVTNGTYKVTARTAGTGGNGTDGTITLDMDDATGTTADVRIVVNNSPWYAGAVAKGGWVGETGPRALDIYVPNGAIIPVRTNKDCTIGESLGLGSAVFEAATGDNDPVAVALCMETVNRSSANGLVLAKTFDTGQQILAGQAYFAPVRGKAGGYVYGVQVDGTKILRGTAASKSYVMQISGERESGYAATGDSNDALLKVAGSNYGACDTNFYMRGLNCNVSNRSGGTLGFLTNTISISLKQGSTAANAVALQVDAQDLAATAKTEFGGLDVAINREGLAATTEYGVQIRTRGTINTKIDSVFRIEKGTDHGFTNLFALDAAATISMTSSDGGVSTHKIPIDDNGTTRYIMVSDG